MSNSRQPVSDLRIMGHRGAKEIVPENTLSAFQLAIDAGVDAVELDVHLSKDGELIVMHDALLDRTTNGRGAIRDFTLAELKTLNAAATFAGSATTHPQAIPTLQEVYDLVQGRVQINVEIKTAHDGTRYPDLETKLIELVRRNAAASYTVLSSFHFPILATLQTLAPEIRRYAIVARDYFQTIDPTQPALVAADLVAQGFAWVAVNKSYLTKPLVDELHAHGFIVHTWVINEVADLWSFVEMGVDAITTDRPDRLVPAYKRRNA